MNSSEGGFGSMIGPESSAAAARNAPISARTSGTAVSRSGSTTKEPDGTAGIVAGKVRLSETAIRYAESRGISRATLDQLGVGSGMVWFRDLERKAEACFFPYRLGGETVYWKARAIETKAFTSMAGGRVCFLNLQRVLDGAAETIYVTEGEWDTAALIEAGIPPDSVMSVPSGAGGSGRQKDGEEISGYGYVDEALRLGLSRARRVVWCGDADEAGHQLRAVMAKLFGPARFWFVDWPEGCKDANEVLVSDGPEALLDLVLNGSQPWPISGLYRLAELPEPAPMTIWEPDILEWEGKVKMAAGTLSVVTGWPGMGKTGLSLQIWQTIIRRYDLIACYASFETRAKPHLRQRLRSLWAGRLERDMGHDEKAAADRWINDHYLWMNHLEENPTLEWFLDMAEVAVVRHGARMVTLDPWNRLESQKASGEHESEYIGRCLTELYKFAKDMGCHVQVMAHPSKSSGADRNKPPTLLDISGSTHWYNRVDQGFVVHRPKLLVDGGIESEFIYDKTRFDELGRPGIYRMKYERETGSFRSVDYDNKLGEGAGFNSAPKEAKKGSRKNGD